MNIHWSEIDERLRPLVMRLNGMGFQTSGCCQGADTKSIKEFEQYKGAGGSHHKHAYMQFIDFYDIPDDLKDLVDLSTKVVFRYFSEGARDRRCEFQSVSMLLNKEFPKEINRILDQWEKTIGAS